MPTSVEIVSPEKLLLSRAVDMVVIPAAEGDMGVLEGHSPMIVTLRGGTIDLYEGDKVIERLFVDGGFAEVTPERCTVLANQAVPVGELVKSDAEQALVAAEAAFAAANVQDPDSEDVALDALQAARARVEAAA